MSYNRFKQLMRSSAPADPRSAGGGTGATVRNVSNSAARVCSLGVGVTVAAGVTPWPGPALVSATCAAVRAGGSSSEVSGVIRSGGAAISLAAASAGYFALPIAPTAMFFASMYEGLERSEEAQTYLLGLHGYIITLAGAACRALSGNHGALVPTSLPSNFTPWSERRRGMYIDGLQKARLMTQLFEVECPGELTACFSLVATEASNRPEPFRTEVERYIARDILNLNTTQTRRALTEWARTGQS